MFVRGFTLIEVLVALFVFSIGLLGVAGLQLQSKAALREAHERSTAMRHALDVLERMRAVTQDEVIFVVGYKAEQIESWVRAQYPNLKSHFVLQEEPLGQAHAVWLCRDFLQDDDELVLAFGDAIIDAM